MCIFYGKLILWRHILIFFFHQKLVTFLKKWRKKIILVMLEILSHVIFFIGLFFVYFVMEFFLIFDYLDWQKLTLFTLVLHFIQKPVFWFAGQIKWPISTWKVTLDWNGLSQLFQKHHTYLYKPEAQSCRVKYVWPFCYHEELKGYPISYQCSHIFQCVLILKTLK